MEIDLSPQLAKEVYQNDGGSYFTWSPSELPMLRHGNIGAAMLSLRKFGFALPHYSDCSKIAYVLQGVGSVGIVLPGSEEEKLVIVIKGDALALPLGTVTWWFSDEDTELVVLFLGDTSKAHKHGEFTDFFLAGSNSIFKGFSAEFVAKAWNFQLKERGVKLILNNQSEKRIVKLDGKYDIPPDPKPGHRDDMVWNCCQSALDIEGVGRVVVFDTGNLPLVGEVGLGAGLVMLDGGAVYSPVFSCGSALQVTYIVSGSGTVHVVGVDGCKVLETTVEAGHLFIVPRFFVVSKIADPDGLEWFSIFTTPNPILTHLAGSSAVWKALSPMVLQAAFNVDSGVEQLFRSKMTADAIFSPPPK